MVLFIMLNLNMVYYRINSSIMHFCCDAKSVTPDWSLKQFSAVEIVVIKKFSAKFRFTKKWLVAV